MKVWLNAGRKTNSKLLNDSDIKFFNDLVEEGYIEIVNKSYSIISYKTGFNKVMENFVENLEIMNASLSNDEKWLQAENIRRIRKLQEKYNYGSENSK